MEIIQLNEVDYQLQQESNGVRVYANGEDKVATFDATLVRAPQSWLEAVKADGGVTEYGIAEFKYNGKRIPASVWRGACEAGMLTDEHVGTTMSLSVNLTGEYANYYQVFFGGGTSRPDALALLGIEVEDAVKEAI
jgi:hypothetical protein